MLHNPQVLALRLHQVFASKGLFAFVSVILCRPANTHVLCCMLLQQQAGLQQSKAAWQKAFVNLHHIHTHTCTPWFACCTACICMVCMQACTNPKLEGSQAIDPSSHPCPAGPPSLCPPGAKGLPPNKPWSAGATCS